MQANSILSASLIDIIFDGRNKDYGAYELRKKYSERMGRSLLVTTLLVLLGFGAVAFTNSMKRSNGKYRVGPVIQLSALPNYKKPEKMPEIKKVRAETPT